MAKFIELSAEETISTAELIGRTLGIPLKADAQEEKKEEEPDDGSH